MPAPETNARHQKAVLWPFTGVNNHGAPTVGDPEQIIVRWVHSKRETLDPQGNTIALDATVIVDEDIAIGSEMWLGELEDWYGTGTAPDDSEVMTVKTFNKTPDIKGRVFRRELGLMRKRAGATA